MVVGSTCRSGTRRGADRLCRLSTLPFACFPAPIPLPPFPTGRGRFLLFYCKGLRPLHPRGWRGATLVRRALAAPGGSLPGWSPVLPAVPAPGGGLAVFVACLPCLLLAFLPPSPYPPSQREGGDFCYFIARGFVPCIPGAGGARHWLGFEETIRFGIAGGRRLQLQSITNSRKVLGGLGASFKKPPTFLRSPVPSFSRSFVLPFLND